MKLYEQSIRIITAFFLVLVGLAVKHVTESPDITDPELRCALSLLSIFLFMRYLLGSANHLWYEYVKDDPAQVDHWSLIKDFTFLTLFGLIALPITFSKKLEPFLEWNAALVIVAVIWSWITPTSSKADWGFLFRINLAQLFAIVIFRVTLTGLAWAVWVLVATYLILLGIDFNLQLKCLEGRRDRYRVWKPEMFGLQLAVAGDNLSAESQTLIASQASTLATLLSRMQTDAATLRQRQAPTAQWQALATEAERVLTAQDQRRVRLERELKELHALVMDCSTRPAALTTQVQTLESAIEVLHRNLTTARQYIEALFP